MTYLFYSLLIVAIIYFGANIYGNTIMYDNHWYQFSIDRGLTPEEPQIAISKLLFICLIPIVRWAMIAVLIMMISVDYLDIRDDLGGRC